MNFAIKGLCGRWMNFILGGSLLCIMVLPGRPVWGQETASQESSAELFIFENPWETNPAAVQRLAALEQRGQSYFDPQSEESIINASLRSPLTYPYIFTELTNSPTFAKDHPLPGYCDNQLRNILGMLLARTVHRQGIIDFFEDQDMGKHTNFRKVQMAMLLGQMVGARPEKYWSYQVINHWFKSAASLAQGKAWEAALPENLREPLPDFAFYQAVSALAASTELAKQLPRTTNEQAFTFLKQQITPYLQHPDAALRFIAFVALGQCYHQQGKSLPLSSYFQDPTWVAYTSKPENSRVHLLLRLQFILPLLDTWNDSATSAAQRTQEADQLYAFAQKFFLMNHDDLDYRLFEGETAALNLRMTVSPEGQEFFYQSARRHVARTADEDYYDLALKTTLLPHFGPAHQALREADATALFKSDYLEDRLMVVQTLMRRDFWPPGIEAEQFSDLRWWKDLFENYTTPIPPGIFVQKVMRGIRGNPAHRFDHLAVPLMILYLKMLGKHALANQDYLTIDETIYNVGTFFARQRPLHFLTGLIESLLHWNGQLPGIDESPEETALNISLGQLLAFSMMENINKRDPRQEIFQRFKDELLPQAGRDPLVQMLGVLTMSYDPAPDALSKIQLIFRQEKNIQTFFRADSWWPSRVRFEIFLRRNAFFLRRRLPSYRQQVAVPEDILAEGLAHRPSYTEDHLNLRNEEDLALAQQVVNLVAQTAVFYLKNEVKQRGTSNWQEQIRLANFISVLVGRFTHFQEPISMMLDYLLPHYHPPGLLDRPAQEHEEFLATALGAMLCDYYAHVKTKQMDLFTNTIEHLLKHPRPLMRLIGIYLATQNGDFRGINRDFFTMMADAHWIKDYLRQDRDKDFTILDRVLALRSRLYFQDIEASLNVLKSSKKFKAALKHPFIDLRPYKLLEITRLYPSFDFGNTPKIEVLDREVPRRLAAEDFTRFPEDLAWLDLQDETWFGKSTQQAMVINYLSELLGHLIATAQNDELDVVRLNYTHGDRRLRSYLAANFALVVVHFPSFFVEKFCLHLIALVEQGLAPEAQEAYISAIIHLLSHVDDAARILATPEIQRFLGKLLNHPDSAYQAMALAVQLAPADKKLNQVALSVLQDDAWLKQFMNLDSSELNLNSRWSNILNGLVVNDREVFTPLLMNALYLLLEKGANFAPITEPALANSAPFPKARQIYAATQCQTSLVAPPARL